MALVTIFETQNIFVTSQVEITTRTSSTTKEFKSEAALSDFLSKNQFENINYDFQVV